jgi:hypothetical protein
MTEEQVTNNQEPQETPPAPASGDTSPPPADDEPSYKKHMAAEINKLRAEKEALIKSQQEAAEAAKRKELEAQGKWQEIAENAQRERDELARQHAAERRQLKLEAGLAGIESEFTRLGVIAKCPTEADPDEYVAQVRKDNPELWASSEPGPRIGGQGVRSSTGSAFTNERAIIEKATASPGSVKPRELRAALDKVRRYREQHGKDPW